MLKLAVIICLIQLAHATEYVFNPITSIATQTIPKYSFALVRSPIGNLNSNFLTSSLNFSPLERVEIGVVPMFYLISEHKYNYNIKYNFYRGDIFNWAITVGSLVFKTEVTIIDETERPDLKMSTVQLATNIKIPNSRYTVGSSITRSCGIIDSSNTLVKSYSYNCANEVGLDLQIEIYKNKWITIGQGRNREAGFSPYEEVENGYGLAYTWVRKGKFLSRPTLGYYLSENGNNLFLFNTTFN